MRCTKRIVLGLFGLVAWAGVASAQNSAISIGTDSGLIGDEITVPVSLDANNHNVANIDFDIGYDANELELRLGGDSCGFIDIGPGVGQPISCTDLGGGVVRVLVDAIPTFPIPVMNEGVIFSLRFTVAATATVGATTPVTFVSFALGDDAAGAVDPSEITAAEGSVEVLDTPPIPPEELSELSVSPASINFGTVDLGSMPVSDTITAENTGGVDSSLTINSASLSGDAEFSIVTNGCAGTSLAFGETCDVVVEFNAGADGTYSGSVDFTSDADSNPNASVSLAGEAGSAPDVSVTPAPGTINLGTGLQGDTLTSGGSFSNSGSAAGDVSCTVSGAEFSTVPSPIAGTIEPGGSLDFSVQCTLPADAEDGDTFGGALVCSGDIDATWELSCGVSEWEPLPVPTMQKWGLIVLTLMMLMVGGLSIRFFRN